MDRVAPVSTSIETGAPCISNYTVIGLLFGAQTLKIMSLYSAGGSDLVFPFLLRVWLFYQKSEDLSVSSTFYNRWLPNVHVCDSSGILHS